MSKNVKNGVSNHPPIPLARAECFTFAVKYQENIFRESFALLIVTNIIDEKEEISLLSIQFFFF